MFVISFCYKKIPRNDRKGVFSWLTNELLKMTKGHPIRILIALGLFTAVVSAFLDNVTTVILIMPITFSIAKNWMLTQSLTY